MAWLDGFLQPRGSAHCLDVDCEVPAVFTFGLSIPVGAGIGLMAGATTGGGAGVVGGEDLRFLILSGMVQ